MLEDVFAAPVKAYEQARDKFAEDMAKNGFIHAIGWHAADLAKKEAVAEEARALRRGFEQQFGEDGHVVGSITEIDERQRWLEAARQDRLSKLLDAVRYGSSSTALYKNQAEVDGRSGLAEWLGGSWQGLHRLVVELEHMVRDAEKLNEETTS